MGIGTYPGFVNVLPKELLEKHVPEEFAHFNKLVDRYSINLGMWANAVHQGDDEQALDAMEIETEDDDSEPIPQIYEMSEIEYKQMVYEEAVEALDVVTDAFKERTGVTIGLWCMQAGDCGSSADLDLDEAYWIIDAGVDLKPEVKALGLEFWPTFRDYFITS